MEANGKALARFDEGLRARLQAYKESEGIVLKVLASRIGSNEAAVSRYLEGKPTGDVAKLEAKILDHLDADSRRRTWNEMYFSTRAVDTCRLVFDIIRESGDIGLIHGPAGIGKTTACKAYARDHRTVIFFTAMQGRGSCWDIIKSICAHLPTPRSEDDKRLKKVDWVMQKLAGSGRLVIIDNAQRISVGGLRWLMDFNDTTGCPVALVGNPEVMDKIRDNDQMSSRIGFKQDIAEMIEEDKTWLDEAAAAMVKQMWPQAAKDIRLLAREAAHRPGHLRTLNKQLRIAIRLSETTMCKGQTDGAFVAARSLIGATSEED